MAIVDDIVSGKIQEVGNAHLCNPIVKAIVVFVPLLLGSFGILMNQRGTPLPQGLMWLAAAMSLFVKNFDFRAGRRGPMIHWGIASLLVASLVAIDSQYISLIDAVKATWLARPFVAIEKYITASELANVVLFCVSARTITIVSARDALWYGRLLPFRRASEVYITIVVTYFFLTTAFGKRLSESVYVARSRYSICRRNRGIANALFTAGKQFTDKFLGDSTELASIIASVLRERGYFSSAYRDEYWRYLSSEDIALIVLGLVALSLLVVYPAVAI